jgi:hypothetical protein
MTMVRIGEALFTDVDTDGTVPANEFNAIWDLVLEANLGIGPEKGWEFAKWNVTDVDVDSTDITLTADYSGTVAGTTLVTSIAHGLLAGDQTVITGTSIDGQYKATKLTDDTFYVPAAFTSPDSSGSSQWTSTLYNYRYLRPTSIAVTDVLVSGRAVTDWTRKGNWILTSISGTTIDMNYTKVPADLVITQIPAHFNEVQWRQMAIHMLYSRSQNSALQNRLTEEIETIYLPRAIGVDAREQYIQEQSNAWVNAGHNTTVLE